MPIAQKISFIKKTAFINISEIALNYRSSKLSKQDTSISFSNTSLKPGDRVPYNILRKDFTDGINFHLLLFSKINLSQNKMEEFKSVCLLFGDLVIINQVPFSSDTENIYKQFGIQSDGIYLIRPDSYIAYRSQTLKSNDLKQYLQLYLNDKTFASS